MQTEFDEITRGIDEVMERASSDSRDLTEEENKQIERDDARRTDLEKSIQHYSGIAERSNRVQVMRSRIPSPPAGSRGVVESEPEFDVLREWPTPGHYAATLHAAWVKRDKAAIALLERATAHQVLADTPGLVPQVVAGPVVNRMRQMRPLIESVGTNTPPGPKFDRPIVVQQVDVGAQVNEKDLTASRKLTTSNVPITLQTHAGHLNISKQDVRWSNPSILTLVYESFAKMYARVSDSAACSVFVTAVTQAQEIGGAAGASTAKDFDAAIGAAAATIGGTTGDNGELNHMWMSRDVAVGLASARSTDSSKLWNIPLVNGTNGDYDGIPVTIDPRFASGTWIAGDDTLVEFWEDLEGFLSVDEPDLLGQLVGYAGYNKFAVLDPTGFVKLTNTTLQAAASDTGGRRK